MRSTSLVGLLSLSLVSLPGLSGCIAGEDPTGAGASGAGTSNGANNAGGSGGSTGSFVGSGGGNQTNALTITPLGPSLDVVFGTPGQTVQFTATRNGLPVNPTWFLNTPEAGTIDGNGLFTANGAAGGNITVSATIEDEVASTVLRLNLAIVENTAALPQDQQDILSQPGGAADPSMTVPYPYTGTVFPRAIPAPQVHLNGGGASAYMLKVANEGCSYTGFLPPSAQITMGQAQWNALGTCSDGTDMTVEIAKLSNGQKLGPVLQTWRIAPAKLNGTIYYNTYGSPLAGTGALMRTKAESTVPEVLVGNCTVCHSIASDGSTAAAANHAGPGGTFDLSGDVVNPPLVWTTAETAAFAALYPKNGEVLVVQGAPGGSWPPNTPGTSGFFTSELRTKTGELIPDSGIEGKYAQTPVFSHDGTMLAFTDRNAGNTALSTLALYDYDAVTRKFTNYRILATPPAGQHYAWPAFTPDNKWVVFQAGVGEDLATWQSNTAKLSAINVETGVLVPLSTLNGDGYMPGGVRDENLNFEPTILPIAAGGYFWVVFTSRRTYGNVLTGSREETKRLWVAAFDADAGDTDASHPAFYIAGQELGSGNSRGFWALDPCKATGQTCETGDECCGGFCNPSETNPGVFECGEPDGSCSDEFEACETAADCCDPSLACIGGKCGSVPPQ